MDGVGDQDWRSAFVSKVLFAGSFQVGPKVIFAEVVDEELRVVHVERPGGLAPQPAASDYRSCHIRLSKRFAALSTRVILVALAPGTGKSTLTALLNEALRRKSGPKTVRRVSFRQIAQVGSLQRGGVERVPGIPTS